MDNLVSVIIPVYNSEKYLRKCFDSLLNQEYRNIEVIAVNDGSTDRSEEILNEYKEKYPYIFNILNQKNQGQSVARNKALEVAKGEYVTFLDSDDYIKSDYIKMLVETAYKNKSDMVASGEFRIDENGKLVSKIRYKTDRDGNCVLRRLNFSGKLYRRDFLEKHYLQFAEGKIYEDNPFNIKAYALAHNLQIVDYMGYYQTVHIGSTTTKQIQADKLPFHEMEEMIQYVQNHKNEVEDYNLFAYTVFSFFTYFIFKANKQHYYFELDGRKSSMDLVYEICDYVQRMINDYFDGYIHNPYVRIAGNVGVSWKQSAGVWLFMRLIATDRLKKFVKRYYRY